MAERLNLPAEDLARVNGVEVNKRLRRGQRITLPSKPPAETAQSANEASERQTIGQRIRFFDGTTFDADNVWRDGADVWYRSGTVSHRIERQVRSVEPMMGPAAAAQPVPKLGEGKILEKGKSKESEPAASPVWIYLVGGARVKVDEVNETDGGAWYRRGNLSVFLNRERIARIEKEEPGVKEAGWKQLGWTSGNAKLNELISVNGARFGVDPYLIFCVIEQESQFRVRAVSPKGARGLMQLMPGAMVRYGISNPFDPAANIRGGTQYLKELMGMFAGRVDLVLAGYNAGEAAVIKYGREVPPYKETRDYVKRISRRYQESQKAQQRAGTTVAPRDQ